jgi:hypothetical protein
MRLLNGLLENALVGPHFAWTERSGFAIVNGPHGECALFGTLVLQLVHECVKVESAAICDECGKGFKAVRRDAKFCPKCRARGVPLKRAKQAERARLRARGLSSRGRALPVD